MKIQALNLGEYGATLTFRLYRFPMPVSPPLSTHSPPKIQEHEHAMYYYCLEDLERLGIASPESSFRHVNTVKLYRDYPSGFCKNSNNGYTYVNTQILTDLATCFKSSLLMDLCQLTEHTPLDQQLSLLQSIPLLDTTKRNNNRLHHQSMVSSATCSLSPINNSIHVHLVEQVLNPVRLDGQEWFLQPWIQKYQKTPPLIIRLSPPPLGDHETKINTDNTTITNLNNNNNNNNNNTNNNNQSRTRQSSLLLQRRLAPKLGHHAPHLTINTPIYKDHHLHSIQSAPLRKSMTKQQINKRLQAAAAAAAAIPPPPMPWSSRVQQSVVVPSQHSSKKLSQSKKNQFLQPFEHLQDTLEHTRGQKAKLDDLIRQSAAWMSQTQLSLPIKIEKVVAEQMDLWMSPYLDQLQQCMDRLLRLEEKTQLPVEGDNNNDKMELIAFMHRLDQLERKVAASGQKVAD